MVGARYTFVLWVGVGGGAFASDARFFRIDSDAVTQPKQGLK